MTRQLKLLALAAVAVLALSAVSAASASAASFFTTQSTPTFIKGLQQTKNVFTDTAGTIKCSAAEFTSGQISSNAVGTVNVHPTYGGCTAFGQAASVSTTSCSYTLSIVSVSGSTGDGSIVIDCSSGTTIVINLPAAGCSVTIGAQSFPGGGNTIDYESIGSGATEAILVTSTVSAIVWAASGGICDTNSTGATASITGTVLTKGYDQAAFSTQHGIFVG